MLQLTYLLLRSFYTLKTGNKKGIIIHPKNWNSNIFIQDVWEIYDKARMCELIGNLTVFTMAAHWSESELLGSQAY